MVGPADVTKLAVHIMANTALTGATNDIEVANSSSRDNSQQFAESSVRLAVGHDRDRHVDSPRLTIEVENRLLESPCL